MIITMVTSTERMNVFKEHDNGPLKIGPCADVSFESCGTMALNYFMGQWCNGPCVTLVSAPLQMSPMIKSEDWIKHSDGFVWSVQGFSLQIEHRHYYVLHKLYLSQNAIFLNQDLIVPPSLNIKGVLSF